jgi:hypothetical protein
MGNLSIVVGCNYPAANLKRSNLEEGCDILFKYSLASRFLLRRHVAKTEISASCTKHSLCHDKGHPPPRRGVCWGGGEGDKAYIISTWYS